MYVLPNINWHYVKEIQTHLHVAVKMAQVVHDAVHVQLARTQDHMLATLFNFGGHQWVALVDAAKSLHLLAHSHLPIQQCI